MKIYLNYILLIISFPILFSCAEDDPENGNLIFPPKINPKVRFFHILETDKHVSIYSNDSLIYSDLLPNETTGYLELPGEEFIIKVDDINGNNLITQPIETEYGDSYSIFLTNKDGKSSLSLERDKNSDVPSLSKLRFFHNAPEYGKIDIRLNAPDGNSIFNGVSYDELTLYRTINGNIYSFVITEGGTENQIAASEYIELQDGTVYTVLIDRKGIQQDQPALRARFYSDKDSGNEYFDIIEKEPEAFLNIMHALTDTISYDLFIDDSLYNDNSYIYPNTTGYRGVPAEKPFQLKLVSPEAGIILDTTISPLVEFGRYSGFVHGLGNNPSFLFLEDNFTEISENMAKWRFVNLSLNSDPVIAADKDKIPFFGEGIYYNHAEYSDFVDIKTGSFDVRFFNQAEEEVYKSPRLNVDRDNYYTLIFRGINKTDEVYPYRTSLIQNK